MENFLFFMAIFEVKDIDYKENVKNLDFLLEFLDDLDL